MKIELDKSYEIKCSLGTIKEIEANFDKPFISIINSLDKMSMQDQIKMLYLGAKRANGNLSEAEFNISCDDNLGLAKLSEIMEEYILQLQYPGSSTSEIQKKIHQRIRKMEEMKNSTGMKSLKTEQ